MMFPYWTNVSERTSRPGIMLGLLSFSGLCPTRKRGRPRINRKRPVLDSTDFSLTENPMDYKPTPDDPATIANDKLRELLADVRSLRDYCIENRLSLPREIELLTGNRAERRAKR